MLVQFFLVIFLTVCSLLSAADSFFCSEVLLKPYSGIEQTDKKTFFEGDRPDWHELENYLAAYTAPVQKHMTIMILSRNNQKYYKANLSSVFAQNYDNYNIIYVDDASTDGTDDLVAAYVQQKKQSHRFTLIKHHERQYALQGCFDVFDAADPLSIIVTLDGDDAFLHPRALELINKVYCLGDRAYKEQRDEFFKKNRSLHLNMPKDIWVVCGNSYNWFTQSVAREVVFPTHVRVTGAFRKYYAQRGFNAMHPRTFYCWLARSLEKEALLYNGTIPRCGHDVGLMFALLERGLGSFFWINDVLYGYNLGTGFNDAHTDRDMQIAVGQYYRLSVPPLKPLLRSKRRLKDMRLMMQAP